MRFAVARHKAADFVAAHGSQPSSHRFVAHEIARSGAGRRAGFDADRAADSTDAARADPELALSAGTASRRTSVVRGIFREPDSGARSAARPRRTGPHRPGAESGL